MKLDETGPFEACFLHSPSKTAHCTPSSSRGNDQEENEYVADVRRIVQCTQLPGKAHCNGIYKIENTNLFCATAKNISICTSLLGTSISINTCNSWEGKRVMKEICTRWQSVKSFNRINNCNTTMDWGSFFLWKSNRKFNLVHNCLFVTWINWEMTMYLLS